MTVSLGGAFALVAVTLALALAAAFIAPRGPSDLGIKLASLATFALCGLLAVAGLWATWTRSRTLMATAVTGVRDGELPEPAQRSVTEPPAVSLPPPPPPPPRSAVRAASPESHGTGGASPAAPVGEAVRVGGAIPEPRKLKHVNPVYPDIARQARVLGVVILEVAISPRGNVTAVSVLRGIPLLEEAAIDAVRQWVYAPTLLNGVPVSVIMTVEVNYRLPAK